MVSDLLAFCHSVPIKVFFNHFRPLVNVSEIEKVSVKVRFNAHDLAKVSVRVITSEMNRETSFAATSAKFAVSSQSLVMALVKVSDKVVVSANARERAFTILTSAVVMLSANVLYNAALRE